MSEKDFLESISKQSNFDLITNLDISNKNIKEIKTLPKNLKFLNCSNNHLTTLNLSGFEFPSTLIEINCSNNFLNILDNLPKNLRKLNCCNNLLENINLPDDIEEVIYDNNRIEGKLIIKPKMSFLSANSNLITSFDPFEIPRSLKYIYINNNKISYFPKLNKRLYIEIKNNPITKNDSYGVYLFNVTFKEEDTDYQLKLKLCIE